LRAALYSGRSRRLSEPKPALGGVNETDQGTALGRCAPLFGTDRIRICSEELADARKLSGQLRRSPCVNCRGYRLIHTATLSRLYIYNEHQQTHIDPIRPMRTLIATALLAPSIAGACAQSACKRILSKKRHLRGAALPQQPQQPRLRQLVHSWQR
jgi:hypothetical protein